MLLTTVSQYVPSKIKVLSNSVLGPRNGYLFFLLHMSCLIFATLLIMVITTVFNPNGAYGRANQMSNDGDMQALRAIVSGMQPGEWREIPNSDVPRLTEEEHDAIVAAHPGSRNFWGNQGSNGTFNAFNGAAYNPGEHEWYFTGGGHKDYGGNEVYQFDFDTLEWSRLNDPSPISSNGNEPLEGPIARHTYDGIVWNPATQTIWMFGDYGYNPSGYNPVNVRDLIWEFDPDAGTWNSIEPNAWDGSFTQATYNPDTGRIWGFSGTGRNNKAMEFDADGTAYNVGSFSVDYRVHEQLDTANGKMYLFGVGDRQHAAITEITLTDKSGYSGTELQKTWPQELQDVAIWERGIAYHPPSDQFVMWGGRGDIWTWSVDDHQFRRYDVPEGDLPSDRGKIWDKWIYLEEADVFAGYNDTGEGVWLYKLPDSGGEIVDPNEVRAKIGNATYTSIAEAFAAAEDGDTITIVPGDWRESAVLSANNVTVEATGAHLYGSTAQGKAALVIQGDNVTIKGLECSDISVSDGNGACIRQEGSNLTLQNVYFHDSQQGLLGNDDTGFLHIEDSVFERLGHGGRAHGIYVNATDELIVRNSSFLAAEGEGHEIKSRAAKTIIENNVIASLDGRDSRLLDLPNGGEIVIRNNVLQEGPNSSNRDIIGIGFEVGKNGENWPVDSALIEGNTIIVDASKSELLNWRNVPAPVFTGNTVVGGPQDQVPDGNTWVADRGDAGFAPYPYLPQTTSHNPTNAEPNATDDEASVLQDGSVVINVLDNDADPNGGTLSVVAVDEPLQGQAVVNANGTITYTPQAGFFGDDSFHYWISDGQSGIASAAVAVSVVPGGHAPVARADAAETDEGQPVVITPLQNDTDEDNDALSITSLTPALHGTATLKPDGSITYTPEADFVGSDEFTYTLEDATGRTDSATITVSVLETSGGSSEPDPSDGYGFSYYDWSLSLNGRGAVVSPDFAGFDGLSAGGALTVEVGFSTTDTGREGTLVSYATPATADELVIYDPKALKVAIGDQQVETNLSLADGDWHHLTVVWEAPNGALKIYDNGTQAFSGTLNPGHALAPGGTLVFGQDQDTLGGGFDDEQAFQGRLDDIRIWDKALTPSDAGAFAEAAIVERTDPDYDHLLADFRMNEGGGRTAVSAVDGTTASLSDGGVNWLLDGQLHDAPPVADPIFLLL